MKGLSLYKLNAGYQKKNVICDLSLSELPRGKITIILGTKWLWKVDVATCHWRG